MDAPPPPSLWVGQTFHFFSLAILAVILFGLWTLIGRPAPIAFWTAAIVPVLHQVWVWLAWRLELQHQTISRTVGFQGYLAVFFALFIARFLTLAWLAIQDQGSLGLTWTPLLVVTTVLLIPSLYAMYSVQRYFGMSRAAGGDHFEQRFRELPLEQKGIFRFTDNGMYVFAFLLFWAIAISLNSLAALVIAAFSHAYIWVHYFATEKPDMAYFYYGK